MLVYLKGKYWNYFWCKRIDGLKKLYGRISTGSLVHLLACKLDFSSRFLRKKILCAHEFD